MCLKKPILGWRKANFVKIGFLTTMVYLIFVLEFYITIKYKLKLVGTKMMNTQYVCNISCVYIIIKLRQSDVCFKSHKTTQRIFYCNYIIL